MSNSIVNERWPCGSGRVVRPRDVPCSATAHECLMGGACASATLPTTWVQRCSVAYVSFHAPEGIAGQNLSATRAYNTAMFRPLLLTIAVFMSALMQGAGAAQTANPFQTVAVPRA